MTEDQFSAASKVAWTRVKQAGGLSKCALPIQVALNVESAQGIIDNGGLQYFYEVDFEEQCSYTEFVKSYRLIGAEDAATHLERSISLFPFSNPHLHQLKRANWLNSISDIEQHEFHELSDKLIGHKSVFPKLMSYIEKNWSYFRD